MDAHTGLNACGQVEIRGADFKHGAQEVSDLHRSVRTRDTQHLINRRDDLDELIQPGSADRVHTAPEYANHPSIVGEPTSRASRGTLVRVAVTTGPEYVQNVVDSIDASEESIHMTAYNFTNAHIVGALKRALDRNVEVWIAADERATSTSHVQEVILEQLRNAGAQIAL